MNERIRFIKEEIDPKKHVILKEELERRIEELKHSHSPVRKEYTSPIRNEHKKQNKHLNKVFSLPALSQSRGTSVNQSFNSSVTAGTVGFTNNLFKIWQFRPSI